MEEKKLIKPISEEEFKEKAHDLAMQNHIARTQAFKNAGILSLRVFDGVKLFKSIRRAIRRGHVSLYGDVYPNRPFSNGKTKKGNPTYNRRLVYEQYRTHNE